jgi:DNA-3-methyladenine glycosylase II
MSRNGSSCRTGHAVIPISYVPPYNFVLSLNSTLARGPDARAPESRMRIPAWLGGRAVIIQVTAANDGEKLRAESRPESDSDKVRALVEWVLFARLDLAPFYRLAGGEPRLTPIIQSLCGLKPTRPTSLFEMAVIAITEQQVSLASAYRVRERLVHRFGKPVEDLWVFPTAETLASATVDDLRSVGLTRQKSAYVHALSNRVASGELDLDALAAMDDTAVKETIMGWHGFGAWSAEYVLVRGLARPDRVPPGDIGIRRVVGAYLGNGSPASTAQVDELLEPFRPWRGLLAFYLLVYHRRVAPR